METWKKPLVPGIFGFAPEILLTGFPSFSSSCVPSPISVGKTGYLVAQGHMPVDDSDIAALRPYVILDIVLRSWEDEGKKAHYVMRLFADTTKGKSELMQASLTQRLHDLRVIPPKKIEVVEINSEEKAKNDYYFKASFLEKNPTDNNSHNFNQNNSETRTTSTFSVETNDKGIGEIISQASILQELRWCKETCETNPLSADSKDLTNDDLRLALVANIHSESPIDFSEITIQAERLATWREAASQLEGALSYPVVETVRSALANNIDVDTCLKALDEWAQATIEGDSEDYQSAEVIDRLVDARLGIKLL